jgi:hypothetical protein
MMKRSVHLINSDITPMAPNKAIDVCKLTIYESVGVSRGKDLDIPEEPCRKDRKCYDTNDNARDGPSRNRSL